MLAGREPIEGTPGADYLTGRGIGLEVAHDVRFHASWYGKGPAVVFAIRDKNGDVVAAQGRFLAGNVEPKAQTCGPMRLGVYQTPKALNRHALVVTEAPIDALSLWACDVPAVALIGTSAPKWLARAGAFRPVFLALDADKAGDEAADKLRPTFEALGATVTRLRPPIGKDWNDVLRAYNQDGMTAWLQDAIGPELSVVIRRAGTSEGDLKPSRKSNVDDTPPADLPPPPWALDPAWNGLEARGLWWRIARTLARRLERGDDREALEAIEADAAACVDARDLEGLRDLAGTIEK
jgi:DNA primase